MGSGELKVVSEKLGELKVVEKASDGLNVV